MNADEQMNPTEQLNPTGPLTPTERTPDEQPTLVIPPADAVPETTPAPIPTVTPYSPPTEEKRLPARVSTIVWGILLLGFCAWTGVIALGGSIPNPITWLTTALIVGGIALVLVGIAAAVRRR
ncbi:hypothetical protein HQQ81_03055 [Microbacteriaceae bacterium VKM Ac-2854]|nr:hypothetical protein [Microbacteriaceae bacterium VKM Ac-2854]